MRANKNPDIKKLEILFADLITELGFSISDPNLIDTPARMAKMYAKELFIGSYEDEPKFTVFDNQKEYDEMVTLFDIDLKSTCSHHFLPFIGKAHIGYIPGKSICGISKLSRVVKYFMRRPQIQEELTQSIADYLVEKLKPKGLIIVIEARHLCMIARGVEEYNSFMTTSAVRGVFSEPAARREFFNLKQNKLQ